MMPKLLCFSVAWLLSGLCSFAPGHYDAYACHHDRIREYLYCPAAVMTIDQKPSHGHVVPYEGLAVANIG